MKKTKYILVLILTLIIQVGFGQSKERIVSLSGAITEVLDALGLGKQLVAVDVTSDYPTYVNNIPKVSKNRSVTIESISSFKPTLVLGLEGELNATLQKQLQQLKIPFVLFKQDFSEKGLQTFIQDIGSTVQKNAEGKLLAQKIEKEISALKNSQSGKGKKILFIYARGAGYLSVSGTGTSIDAVISMAGYQNAMKGFNGYKTYNTEALVAANPDAILMFDFGISSLGGAEGILKMPGVNLTNAGKNKKIIAMDATLLNNFSIRLPQAISQLQQLLK